MLPEPDIQALFRELPDPTARDQLFEAHRSLAAHLASRYRNRGLDPDDLEQVAFLGLLNAIDRFDPDYGSEFVQFAVPTILGEIKRHFRDYGWATHVSRRAKDMSLAARRANERLSQQLGRSPTVDEVAHELDVPVEEVVDAAALGNAYRPDCLDAPRGRTELSLRSSLGEEDGRLDLLVDLECLQQHLASRTHRERELLRLRFFEDLTQRQIAERLGISQMHVSRLLESTLDKLRCLMRVTV
jgi:RNA polymerase sigma-B factor